MIWWDVDSWGMGVSITQKLIGLSAQMVWTEFHAVHIPCNTNVILRSETLNPCTLASRMSYSKPAVINFCKRLAASAYVCVRGGLGVLRCALVKFCLSVRTIMRRWYPERSAIRKLLESVQVDVLRWLLASTCHFLRLEFTQKVVPHRFLKASNRCLP